MVRLTAKFANYGGVVFDFLYGAISRKQGKIKLTLIGSPNAHEVTSNCKILQQVQYSVCASFYKVLVVRAIG